MQEIWHLCWLCFAGVIAGAINAVAGGGTLVTFPMLLWAIGNGEQQSVIANGTNSFAMFPGAIASMWGYRREIEQTKHWLKLLLPPSIIGALLGAYLALLSPNVFKQLIPWLILTASLLFLLQPAITRWVGIGLPHSTPTPGTLAGVMTLQFLIAVYGGYFGAGIGILMLSGLALIGISDIHHMNGLKTVLAGMINSLAAVMFMWQGKIHWFYGLPMIVASILGGYLGARLARQLNRVVVRWIVICIGIGLSTYYFWKTYGS